jgi:hypothetical protein
VTDNPLTAEYQANGIPLLPEDDGKVCSFKPSLSGTSTNPIIEQGKTALSQLEQDKQTWPNWVCVSRALLELQSLAMAAANKNVPQGPVYRKAVKRYLACYGFDRIHKSTRSLLVEIARNLPAIETWRSTLRPEELLDLNHPRVVLARWKKSLRLGSADAESEEANPPSTETPSDPLAIWATFSNDQKRAILDHEGRSGLSAILSPELLIDITNHVVGLEIATACTTSKFAVHLTKLLRVALTTNDNEASNALSGIRQKIKSNGRSPHDVAIALVGAKKGKRQGI